MPREKARKVSRETFSANYNTGTSPVSARRHRPRQENRQQRRQRLFSCSPIVGAVHAATSSLLRFTPLQAIPCATTTASGRRKQKPPRSYRNTSKFGKATKTADTAHSIEKARLQAARKTYHPKPNKIDNCTINKRSSLRLTAQKSGRTLK